MTDTIAIILGMTFVGVILICLVGTIIGYIFNSIDAPGKRNKKLIDNMNKYGNKRR